MGFISLSPDFPRDARAPVERAKHHSSPIEGRRLVLVRTCDPAVTDHWAQGQVIGLSLQECRLVVEGDLICGTALEITFLGFAPRAVHVVSAGEGPARCQFDAPLPVAILDHLIRMSDGAVRR